jgi:hypothetical protein
VFGPDKKVPQLACRARGLPKGCQFTHFRALPVKDRTYVHPQKSCSEIAEGVGLEPTSPFGQRFSRPSAFETRPPHGGYWIPNHAPRVDKSLGPNDPEPETSGYLP